ncbi:MAG: helix-turn-helix domain-containing protein [Candidatus Omnitrophica bacterium]|nr:helix-turn-helix domain-containing protein [Candidatus Omnitrophota bacterium]
MDKNLLALTTGQAARYCFVSSDTIANWIKADCLPAQRTVGGQFRILVDDLHHFMRRHGMSTDLLDQELETRCYCWESHSGCGKPTPDSKCERCPVFQSMAFNCFYLRSLIPKAEWLCSNCNECAYFQKWAGVEMQESVQSLDMETQEVEMKPHVKIE